MLRAGKMVYLVAPWARWSFQYHPRVRCFDTLEAAVARFGPSSGPDPDLDELVALDAEVRASLATSPARAGA